MKNVAGFFLDALKSALGFVLRVALVIAFFLGGGLTFLYVPNLMPVPNAWAETARGALQAISAVTGAAETILSSNGALYAFGQIFPGEDTNLNRIAMMQKDSCAIYTADGIVKTGAGMLSRITFLSGTAATAIIYDNTAASGTKIFDNSAIGITPTTSIAGPTYPQGAGFGTGAYLDIGGTSPVVQICTL